ncbi:MAG: hypothetical protein WBJ54_09870 [Syntrophorhabdus sp.]|nr:hypothetical protein [Syntrophorhabdus sp.]
MSVQVMLMIQHMADCFQGIKSANSPVHEKINGLMSLWFVSRIWTEIAQSR